MSTSFILHFLFGALCGYQIGNTIIKLRNDTPLRWIDWATPPALAAVALLNVAWITP